METDGKRDDGQQVILEDGVTSYTVGMMNSI